MTYLPYPLPPQDQCWPWGGSHRESDGRPVYRKQYAYRLTYEQFIGPVPSGRPVLHHVCENPWCVNPWHLEPLTQSEHAKRHDRFAGQPWQVRKTTCPRGHRYDRVTVKPDGSEERYCSICHEDWKNGRKEWLVRTGHLKNCNRSRCRDTCTATEPVGTYHHVWS